MECLCVRSLKWTQRDLQPDMVCHCMQQTLTALDHVTGGSQKSTIAHSTCSTGKARLVELTAFCLMVLVYDFSKFTLIDSLLTNLDCLAKPVFKSCRSLFIKL